MPTRGRGQTELHSSVPTGMRLRVPVPGVGEGMSHRAERPPRRLILGILLVSLSLLTAVSLPGIGLGQAGGPFSEVWISFWLVFFGLPGVWAIVIAGLLWGSALLLRWERSFLWRLALILGPLVISWDAWMVALGVPSAGWLLHGRLGIWLYTQIHAFFGMRAGLQVAVALGTLAVTVTILLLRWGLPAPAGERVGGVIRMLLRAGRRALGAMVMGVIRLAGATGRHLLLPLGRHLVRVLAALGRLIAVFGDRALGSLRSIAPWPAAVEAAAGGRAAGSHPVVEDAAGSGEPPSREPAEHPGGRALGMAEAVAYKAAAAGPREARGAAPADSGVAQQELPMAAASSARRSKTPVAIPAVRNRARAVATLDLLTDVDSSSAVPTSEIQENARRLVETLASFGIQGEIGEVHPGPVITQYEFAPGVGVTISQITSRQNDLALALRAPSVRLLAPIPGKAAVGVEIPNHEPALISFKDIASCQEFQEARSPLAVALGKDVAGRPFFAALDAMPHVLVAGTTGSGKSVCLNTLIASLLLRNDPSELRLLLIDPKMLELTVYNGIPHLLKPVLTDSRESARALQWLTREMERRYRAFARLGVRNIAAYRQRAAEERAAAELAGEAAEDQLETMPYIVVIVDELADLMMSNQAEVEIPIARLAQMARAVGIHLVLATQRPSVDVITGVIKANFPARIAFQVASRTDSRTILDMNGAESLIGRGDMLFIPPGKAQAHRIHGAFISDGEIESLAAYLRQFPPAEEIAQAMDEDPSRGISDELDDPLYNEALRIVVATQQGSTSFLQRRLRVGYTRAGRLMDMLESNGIVGPPDGSRAREVLVATDYLEPAGSSGRNEDREA